MVKTRKQRKQKRRRNTIKGGIGGWPFGKQIGKKIKPVDYNIESKTNFNDNTYANQESVNIDLDSNLFENDNLKHESIINTIQNETEEKPLSSDKSKTRLTRIKNSISGFKNSISGYLTRKNNYNQTQEFVLDPSIYFCNSNTNIDNKTKELIIKIIDKPYNHNNYFHNFTNYNYPKNTNPIIINNFYKKYNKNKTQPITWSYRNLFNLKYKFNLEVGYQLFYNYLIKSGEKLDNVDEDIFNQLCDQFYTFLNNINIFNDYTCVTNEGSKYLTKFDVIQIVFNNIVNTYYKSYDFEYNKFMNSQKQFTNTVLEVLDIYIVYGSITENEIKDAIDELYKLFKNDKNHVILICNPNVNSKNAAVAPEEKPTDKISFVTNPEITHYTGYNIVETLRASNNKNEDVQQFDNKYKFNLNEGYKLLSEYIGIGGINVKLDNVESKTRVLDEFLREINIFRLGRYSKEQVIQIVFNNIVKSTCDANYYNLVSFVSTANKTELIDKTIKVLKPYINNGNVTEEEIKNEINTIFQFYAMGVGIDTVMNTNNKKDQILKCKDNNSNKYDLLKSKVIPKKDFNSITSFPGGTQFYNENGDLLGTSNGYTRITNTSKEIQVDAGKYINTSNISYAILP